MKKLFSILAILMMATTAWAQVYTLFGDGTSANPYKISRAEELLLFIEQVNQEGQTDVYCELTDDINMSDFGDKFAPIGTWDKPYSGTFNGNGHRIKNLTYSSSDLAGVFGCVSGTTTIKNLIVDSSCSFTRSEGYGAAGLVGCMARASDASSDAISITLENCGNEANVTGDVNAAGLIGGVYNTDTNGNATVTITNCYNTGKITGNSQSAAFIGYGNSKVTVKNCYNMGAVTGCDENHSLIRYKEGAKVSASNIYNLSTVASDEKATSTTAEELADGSICYLLNGSTSTGTLAWYQTLNTDTHPVLENTHGTVYFAGTKYCPVNSYVNTCVGHTEGTANADGEIRCSVCNHLLKYQEPSQDTSGNYLIGNKGNLIWFANTVDAGQTSINGKLTADIDLGDDQTMIGTGKDYQGTFDGDEHTITVHYVATQEKVALFSTTQNANIQNLHVAGSISTNNKYAGGIVGYAICNISITNCSSSVAITNTSSSLKNAYSGGIIGGGKPYYNDNKYNLTNVIFNGKLIGPDTRDWGGLIGDAWNANLTNCLFAPTEVNVNVIEGATLARANSLYVSNCYYTKAINVVQGKPTTTTAAASGELCYNLNNGKVNGSQTWYQNLDNGQTIDTTPVPFKTHGTVYGGETQCGTYSNTQKAHSLGETFDSNGEKICTVCQKAGAYLEPTTDTSGTYLIGNRGNLGWFANAVNAGQTSINGKLTADINLGDNQMMIGTSDNKYAGTFDGDRHTVTVKYTAAENVTALFRYVQNGTIKNLRTAGTISTSKRNAAGVAGICYGVTLEKVISSVAINSTYSGDATHAGLVAETHTNASSVTNCAFTGQLTGSSTTNCAGLVGHIDSGSLSLTNNYVAPSADFTVSTDGSKTLVRNGSPTITNCYYTQTLGGAQGTQVTSEQLRLGDLCNKLNAGNSSTVWTQNLEKDAYPTFGTTGVHYARTMSNAWGTVVLPYDVTYSQSNGNYKLYKLSAADGQNLTFTEYENGTIAAGTPMAVKKISGDGIDIKPASEPNYSTTITPVSEVTNWTMNGTYTALTDQTGIYFIASNQFWWAEKEITIAPFRAWFTGPAPTSSGAPLRIVEGDGSETSTIGEITTDGSVNFFDAPVYNLQGQRLSAPQKGQINIINGKKVSIK